MCAKNLVVCCDGTDNEVAGNASNVLRLFRMLERSERQLPYYDSGVGTISNPQFVTPRLMRFGRIFDSAVGLSISNHFMKAYRFLSKNYEPGDQICIFGFSRGAYTARAVAGAIHRFGLIRPELAGLEDLVWATYSGQNDKPKERFAAAPVFKKAFGVRNPQETDERKAFDVKIHVVGVWDTVSSFGLIWDLQTLPDTANNASIAHVRHAVSIDERRAMFPSNLFRPKDLKQHESFKQVWFAGVHSDVGGGYPEDEGTLSKVSLEWMLNDCTKLGLWIDPEMRKHLMNEPPRHPPADPCGKNHDELKGFWKLLEFLPQRRFSGKKGKMSWHAPNLFRSRKIETLNNDAYDVIKPAIHQSVLDRINNCKKRYAPKNLPPPADYVIEPYN